MTDTVAYKTLQAQITSDIGHRVQAHQAAVGQRNMLAGSTEATQPLNILSTGDSWFNYPLNGDLPGDTDIIAQLPTMITPRPQILNLAHYGDATTTMLGTTKRARFVQQLNDVKNGKFDAILFSGGGDDLVGDSFRFWIRDILEPGDDPTTAMNHDTFGDIIAIVGAAYNDLISIRDAYNLQVPIFIHSYNFAIPDGRGALCIGPWLYPSLNSRGWMNDLSPPELARGAAVVKTFMLAFNAMLATLAKDPDRNVVLVPTQGTPLAATEWANELHPTPGGFAKMASLFVAALAGKFPGRAAPIGTT